MPKIAHALADFAARWEGRPPTFLLERMKLDSGYRLRELRGSTGRCLRVAGLTLDRLGWMHEGEKAGSWDKDNCTRIYGNLSWVCLCVWC